MASDTKRCPQNAEQYTGTRGLERERETPPPAGPHRSLDSHP
jgi:hypothetical protein